MQQEAQRDAPDPRETRPPCYSDAIRMPRLDASFASLNEFGRGKNKRSRKSETDDSPNEDVPLRRNRCRSEEVLSMRSTSTRIPRIHPFENETRDSQNSRTSGIESTSESFEEIRNFNEQSMTALNNRSPYAKRKQERTNGHQETGSNNRTVSADIPGPSGHQMDMTEDHFGPDPNKDQTTIEEEEGSNEFITLKIRRQTEYILPRETEASADPEGNSSRPTSL